jgi:hypothetical protein
MSFISCSREPKKLDSIVSHSDLGGMILMLESLLLEHGPDNFDFLKKTRLHIDGVDDLAEWRILKVG